MGYRAGNTATGSGPHGNRGQQAPSTALVGNDSYSREEYHVQWPDVATIEVQLALLSFSFKMLPGLWFINSSPSPPLLAMFGRGERGKDTWSRACHGSGLRLPDGQFTTVGHLTW
ncbi:hypothetical protein R1flu_017969 [Riccia fluitans]|uniref:Uncharacterized protein n=1 Tax=Riccia fluitans TaxID=41844 RepID=A0ABD1ZFW3_9MARC